MTTAGPNSPASTASVGGGVNWTNVSNIVSSNNLYATALLSANDVTDFAAATNLGFALPTTSTVLGIKVEVEVQKTASGIHVDYRTGGLTKNGTTITGNSDITATEVGSGLGDNYDPFGGASSLWGTTWTATEINTSTFGALVRFRGMPGHSDDTTVQLDHVRITVTYTSDQFITPSGSSTSAGTLNKKITKSFAGTSTNSGTILRSITKFFTGAAASSGLLGLVQSGGTTFQIFVGGMSTSSGELLRSITKNFAGASTNVGTMLKAITKFFTGASTNTGALSSEQITPEPPKAINALVVEPRTPTVSVDARNAGAYIDARNPGAVIFARNQSAAVDERHLTVEIDQ